MLSNGLASVSETTKVTSVSRTGFQAGHCDSMATSLWVKVQIHTHIQICACESLVCSTHKPALQRHTPMKGPINPDIPSQSSQKTNPCLPKHVRHEVIVLHPCGDKNMRCVLFGKQILPEIWKHASYNGHESYLIFENPFAWVHQVQGPEAGI